MLKSKEPGVTDWKDLITNKFIQETNYLHYVVKEALRIDNPIPWTIEYFCVDDVKLCGVPIPKGTKVYIGISGLHNDITQYKEPDRFIPERFDPESKYFFINSNTESESCEDVKGKPRNIHSFITFGSGPRSCPGMSMANFELKVLTAYFICKFKYEVDQDQLSNEAIKFALFSQFDLKIKITEIVNL